jgi:tetratricopeptide (TPR) repeat protein
MQPEFQLAMGRCLMAMGAWEDAMFHLGNVVRVRPKNKNGWMELLRCLYLGGLFEEGFEYACMAFEQTESKPIFLCYQAAFMIALGQQKQALHYLEVAFESKPSLIRQFVELDPSFLQIPAVANLIARHKPVKRKKD